MTETETEKATTVGERIALLRKARGISQYDLDRKAGLAVGSLNHYETGRRVPDLCVLLAIAVALQADLYWLVGMVKPRLAGKVYGGDLWADVNTGTKTRRLKGEL